MPTNIILDSGAGCAESVVAVVEDAAAAREFIERRYGPIEVVGREEDVVLRGAFLCDAQCVEHTDDGHPFVFFAAESV